MTFASKSGDLSNDSPLGFVFSVDLAISLS